MKYGSFNTSGFTQTRLRLGLSQLQLAEQLGISRSAIAMAESGKRDLPVAALVTLAQLEIKLAAANTSVQQITIAEKEAGSSSQSTSLQIRELECEMKIHRLSDKLEKMTARYNAMQVQIKLIDVMIQHEADAQGNLVVMGLQLHRDRLAQELTKYGIAEQALLRNKIALLGAESSLNKSVRQQLI